MFPFLIILIGFIIALTLEKLYPRTKFARKEGWMTRAIIFNSIQFFVVLLASHTWEVWLEGPSLFKLPWTPFWNGIFAYVCTTWVFYWYHLARHENNFLWLTLHQFHHSPVIITAITSFYKHPLEIIINSWIITIITCPILGLDAQTNAWLTIFTGLAEFFYHINISTPQWVGYFIQRPEMHLFHHKEDKQFTWNHGDLAIWDILNGTWLNPTDEETKAVRTGFTQDRERKVIDMLCWKNVLPERPKKLPKNLIQACIISLLFLLGAMNMIALIFNNETAKGVAIISTASPLPFVFSAYQGIETFSTKFEMDIMLKNGTSQLIPVDHKLCGGLKGPYNRRNVIGAVFSHGPFFKDEKMILIRDQIFDWGFCKGHLMQEFGIDEPVDKVTINIKSKTIGNEDKQWTMYVNCD